MNNTDLGDLDLFFNSNDDNESTKLMDLVELYAYDKVLWKNGSLGAKIHEHFVERGVGESIANYLTLTVISACTGNFFAIHNSNGYVMPNCFFMGLGDTSSNKNVYFTFVKDLLPDIKWIESRKSIDEVTEQELEYFVCRERNILGTTVTSLAGYYENMKENGMLGLYYDTERNDTLRTLGNSGPISADSEIKDQFSFIKEKSLGDKNKVGQSFKIPAPTIYYVTQIDRFISNMDDESISGGDLARFLFYPLPNERKSIRRVNSLLSDIEDLRSLLQNQIDMLARYVDTEVPNEQKRKKGVDYHKGIIKSKVFGISKYRTNVINLVDYTDDALVLYNKTVLAKDAEFKSEEKDIYAMAGKLLGEYPWKIALLLWWSESDFKSKITTDHMSRALDFCMWQIDQNKSLIMKLNQGSKYALMIKEILESKKQPLTKSEIYKSNYQLKKLNAETPRKFSFAFSEALRIYPIDRVGNRYSLDNP